MAPFAKAGDSILKDLETPSQSFGAPQTETEQQLDVQNREPNTLQLDTEIYKKLFYEIDAFCFKVENDTTASVLQKNECLSLANALRDALLDKNEKLICQLWIGFNNTLIVNNVNNDSCVKIQNLLEEGNLL